MHYSCDYEEIERAMTMRAEPYPTWTYRRGEAPTEESPFAEQDLEVQPKRHLARGPYKAQYVDAHPVNSGHADPGRITGHPARIMQPRLISSDYPQTFDRPHDLISWAPNPIVQRSYGQYTLVPDDIRKTIPKQMPDYSYAALSQQEIQDAAMLRVRQAMYGR